MILFPTLNGVVESGGGNFQRALRLYVAGIFTPIVTDTMKGQHIGNNSSGGNSGEGENPPPTKVREGARTMKATTTCNDEKEDDYLASDSSISKLALGFKRGEAGQRRRSSRS